MKYIVSQTRGHDSFVYERATVDRAVVISSTVEEQFILMQKSKRNITM